MINLEDFSGVRVSLSVCTSVDGVGRFSELVEHALDQGLPGD